MNPAGIRRATFRYQPYRASEMPARKTPAKAAGSTAKRTVKRRGPAAPRGPEARDSAIDVTSSELAPLVARIARAKGAVIGAYRDPYAGAALVVASLPLTEVAPSPFQRDLSRTHAERLGQAIAATGVFLDPIIAVAADDGFWSPNGRHRLAAAKALGQRAITALVTADPEIAYRILALNTEKAHNLRDRALEAIRMARALAKQRPPTTEGEHAAAFESPHLLTIGAAYDKRPRFAGSSYQSMLKRVDRYLEGTLPAALRQRDQWATRLLDIDDRVAKHIATLQEMGFKSPYLRQVVVARCNPVRWIPTKRGDDQPPMPTGEALTRMAAAVRKFDPKGVRASDLALVAAVAPEE